MTPIGGQTGQANDRACSVVSLLMFGSDVVLRVVGRGVGDPVHQQYNTTRYLWHMQSTRIGTCIGACIVAWRHSYALHAFRKEPTGTS